MEDKTHTHTHTAQAPWHSGKALDHFDLSPGIDPRRCYHSCFGNCHLQVMCGFTLPHPEAHSVFLHIEFVFRIQIKNHPTKRRGHLGLRFCTELVSRCKLFDTYLTDVAELYGTYHTYHTCDVYRYHL